MKKNYSDEELKSIMREVLLENIDKIAATVAFKLKAKVKDTSTFVRNAQRLEFVKRYSTLCAEAFIPSKEGAMLGIYLRDAKKPAGKAIIALAREELNYKPTTYSGDIYRFVGITYLKSVGKWKF